jgi:exosortase
MSAIRSMRWQAATPPIVLGLALAVLIWPAFAHAVEVWLTDEEFTYGFLVPPISLLIVWWRRNALRRSIDRGSTAGVVVVLASLVLMLLGHRTGIHNLTGIAVSPLIVGAAAYLWGWRAARVLLFPSAFLMFGLGLYRGLLNSVGFELQQVTAFGAASLARLLGLHVVRDGLVLHSGTASPEFAFVVAQACSGMSSLLSLLSLAALLIYVTRGSLAGRAAVFASVLPLVVVANVIRVTLVLLVGARFGEDAALGFFHGASSLFLFGLAVGGLLVLSRTVGCKLPVPAFSS